MKHRQVKRAARAALDAQLFSQGPHVHHWSWWFATELPVRVMKREPRWIKLARKMCAAMMDPGDES